MEHKPKTTTFKQKVRDSFKRQAFMDLINAELVDVQPGYCEIHIPYDEKLTQQHGFFHAAY